jgi:hypothetical protein
VGQRLDHPPVRLRGKGLDLVAAGPAVANRRRGAAGVLVRIDTTREQRLQACIDSRFAEAAFD